MELLNEHRVRDLWSKTYNDQGKPDWSHIFPYYDEHIIFMDSIQKVEGFDDFKAMCDRLTQRCESLSMELFEVNQKENLIILEWKMTMEFKKTPSTPIYGSSFLRLNADGKIIHQRDYYDLWGDIFNGIPKFKPLYRKWMKKYFG